MLKIGFNEIESCFPIDVDSLHRYASLSSFEDMLQSNCLLLRNPQVWKKDNPDELYLLEWLACENNVPKWLESLQYKFYFYEEQLALQLYVQKIISFINKFFYMSCNQYAMCFTKGDVESITGDYFWKEWAGDNTQYICFEIYAKYFSVFSCYNDPRALFDAPILELTKVNYCEPSEFIEQFLEDNYKLVGKAFYLKSLSQLPQDEVRLVCHLPHPEELIDWNQITCTKIKQKLLKEKNIINVQNTAANLFLEYVSDFKCKKEQNLANDDDALLMLPTFEAKHFIKSIRPHPKASTDTIQYIDNLCQKHGIVLIS